MSVFRKQCFSTYVKKHISVYAAGVGLCKVSCIRNYLLQFTKVINVPVVQHMFLGAAMSTAAQLVGLRKAFTPMTHE